MIIAIEQFFKKHYKYILTLFSIFFVILLIYLYSMLPSNILKDFEAKSFDLRQNLSLKTKHHNPNIVILAIDEDTSYVLQDELGTISTWNRGVYKDVIDYMEQGKVNTLAFDLMFIGHRKGFEQEDTELARDFGKYDNIFTSMNFDYKENISNKPLPDKLKTKLNNKSNIDFSAMNFSNCRFILDEIIQNTHNIGFINFMRDNDGTSRRAPSFFKYKGNYYPYLALKIADKYLNKTPSKSLTIDADKNLIMHNKKIQLDDNGFYILNWYGPDKTYEYIPFWKVYKSIENIRQHKAPLVNPDYFKNKVVWVGVTATSQYDIKNTPTDSVYPGVEVQATALNNFLDNNFIKKLDVKYNYLICMGLSLLVAIIILAISSTVMASILSIGLGIAYTALSIALMNKFYIWVDIIIPIISMTITFTLIYIVKYIDKAKDFEYTYKLATTDGLTDLYNHRYFQEQMVMNIETCKRYNSHFSLILLDIDFFKKFNDTYGHQAGDAVLRQVAKVLKKNVRNSDIVCRYGGEEMTVILRNTDNEEAYITAEKICKAISEKPFFLREGLERNVTVSLGVATYPQDGITATVLIEKSDQGLYYAKEHGRNQVGREPKPEEQPKA